MKDQLEIENWIKQTPAPRPPADLLEKLEHDLDELHPRPQMAESRPAPAISWRAILRRWLPITGFGGAALVLAFLFFTGSGGRSIADAYENFTLLNSVHVVHHYRSGPYQHVWRDRSLPMNAYPNFSTSNHPLVPLVADDIWFRQNPETGRAEMVTMNERETIWNFANVELRVDHATGERTFRLNSRPLNIQRMAAPLSGLTDFRYRAVTGPDRELVDQPGLESCWLGEFETRGSSVNGWLAAKMVIRVWLNEEDHLARRIEWIDHDFADVSGPWIMSAWEFDDFDEPFNDGLFAFELTESDVAQVGLTLAELEQLSVNALSIELNGEAGVAFTGKVRDSLGTREVTGTLPHVFVVDPVGPISLDVRLSDGKKHTFGISANGMSMQTYTARIKAELGPNGAYSAQSSD